MLSRTVSFEESMKQAATTTQIRTPALQPDDVRAPVSFREQAVRLVHAARQEIAVSLVEDEVKAPTATKLGASGSGSFCVCGSTPLAVS